MFALRRQLSRWQTAYCRPSPIAHPRQLSHAPALLFSSLPQATKNDAGLWVVGTSKSTNRMVRDKPTGATMGLLNRYYAPWQANLKTLLSTHNLALLPTLTMPGE